MFSKYKDYFLFVLVAVLAFFLIFNQLSASSIFDWDEARNGENALEILKTGDWLITRFGEEPDLWNLKPPLGAWLIASGFKIFGINKLTLRFWSALSAVFTVLLVFCFGYSFGNAWAGTVAALFLLAIAGFRGVHGARTGDYDTLVTFFITLALFSLHLAQKKRKIIYWLGTGLAIGLGFLSKSFIGLLPLPIIVFYLFYLRITAKKIFLKGCWLVLLTALIIILPWLIIRWFASPEFILKMYSIDVLSRVNTAVEGHVGNQLFYYYVLRSDLAEPLFLSFIFFLLFSFLLIFRKNDLAALFVFWLAFVFLIFTQAKTKISWYLIPAYPAISLLIGLGFYQLGQDLQKINRYLPALISLFALILIMAQINFRPPIQKDFLQESVDQFKPYLQTVDRIYLPQPMLTPNLFFRFNALVKGRANGYENLQAIKMRKGETFIVNDPEEYERLLANPEYKFLLNVHSLYLFSKN